MRTFLPSVAALLLLVVAAVAFDRMTDRWTSATELRVAARRLDDVPIALPTWGSEAVELDERQLAGAEAVGYYSRRFVELGSDGASVHVMILCGDFGPISVHPPTVCFTGAGWEQLAPVAPRTIEVNGKPLAALHETTFGSSVSLSNSRIRTYWGWGTAGEWGATENPRIAFAGSPHLYKMYVVVDDRTKPDANGNLPEERFLREFLPRVRNALQGGGSATE